MYTFGVHHEHPSANLNNNNETAMKEVGFLSNKFEKVYFVICLSVVMSVCRSLPSNRFADEPISRINHCLTDMENHSF